LKSKTKLKLSLNIYIILVFILINLNSNLDSNDIKNLNTKLEYEKLKCSDGFIGGPYELMNDTRYGVAHFEMIIPSNWFTGLVKDYNNSLLHQSAIMMREANICWNRFEFAWDYVEPINNTWVWDAIDAYMNISDYYGLRILPILCYGTSWASVNEDSLAKPINIEDWKEYIREVVLKYKNRQSFGGYWQIWNEANTQSFFHGDFINDFIPIMIAAAEEIKKIDPESKVIATSLTGENMEELVKTMIEAIGKDKFANLFDAIAIHPYGEYNKAISKIESAIKYLKDWYTGEIWITEYGWSTKGYEPLEIKKEYQANLISKVLVESRALGISHTIIHMWCDWGVGYPKIQDPNDGEHWFGIVDINANPKPAYYIYKIISPRIGLSEFFGTPKLIGIVENENDLKSFIFYNNNSVYITCWSNIKLDAELKLTIHMNYKIFNHVGNIVGQGQEKSIKLKIDNNFKLIELSGNETLINPSEIILQISLLPTFFIRYFLIFALTSISIIFHYKIKNLSQSNQKIKIN